MKENGNKHVWLSQQLILMNLFHDLMGIYIKCAVFFFWWQYMSQYTKVRLQTLYDRTLYIEVMQVLPPM